MAATLWSLELTQTVEKVRSERQLGQIEGAPELERCVAELEKLVVELCKTLFTLGERLGYKSPINDRN